MTVEEAIRILDPETSREALQQYEEYEDRLEVVNEACRVACAALCAQQDSKGVEIDQFKPVKLDRSRWEGCHACEIECCEMCIYEYADKEEYPCSNCVNGNMELTKYKPKWFCAKCGRPLTEESWVELERRINGGTTD